jgi:putative transposase
MVEAAERMTHEEWWRSHAWTDQRTPALAIVARGDQIREVSRKTYSVRSQSHPETAYSVTEKSGRWRCGCPFYLATSMACVHILSVRFKNGLQDAAPIPAVEESLRCESCGSSTVVANGIRHNKSGDVPTYLCRGCGHRFSGLIGFKRRRSDPEVIGLALDLYFRGLSIRKIVEHFQQTKGLVVSRMCVYRWVTHFGKLAAEWMDAQGARTSDRWHIDETVVNVNGDPRYLWNVLDHETRFLLATHVSKNRSLTNTRIPLHKAKAATPDRPVDVLSDGMKTYPEALSKELGRRAKPTDDPKLVRGKAWFSPHRRVPSIRAKESNNRIERFHGTEKERFKVMRAFDNDLGTSALSEGLRAHYNLVRTHQALGMTPGEAAGIPLGDGFRWKRLIKLATEAVPRNGTDDSGESSSRE